MAKGERAGEYGLSQSTPLNHGCLLIASAPSLPPLPRPNPVLPTDKTERLPPPLRAREEADEPSRSSGSHRRETRRSVHSDESRGAGGNLSVVRQFSLARQLESGRSHSTGEREEVHLLASDVALDSVSSLLYLI